jgi:hypothetical protein
VAVGAGGANQADVDRHRLVAQPGLAVEREAFDERLGGARVHAATALVGLHEGAETDAGDQAGAFGGDLAQQHAEHALRQVVGLDAVVEGQRAEPGRQVPMTADDSPHQTLMREMVESARLAVALAGAVKQGQVAWPARCQKAPLQRLGQQFRMAGADEAADRHRGSFGNGGDGFVGGTKQRGAAHDDPPQPNTASSMRARRLSSAWRSSSLLPLASCT